MSNRLIWIWRSRYSNEIDEWKRVKASIFNMVLNVCGRMLTAGVIATMVKESVRNERKWAVPRRCIVLEPSSVLRDKKEGLVHQHRRSDSLQHRDEVPLKKSSFEEGGQQFRRNHCVLVECEVNAVFWMRRISEKTENIQIDLEIFLQAPEWNVWVRRGSQKCDSMRSWREINVSWNMCRPRIPIRATDGRTAKIWVSADGDSPYT